MVDIEPDNTSMLSKNLFPVVGIGASAGGLDAFKKLITAIPENSGMAYILVQHLHPSHESALAEILKRFTKIPVTEITDNVHVEPGNIYVIPSNKTLVATDGILKISPRPLGEKQHFSIDIFFLSLAEVHRDHSIGVVLSGTGGDGTEGLKNIKERGGFTFAQDPKTAAFSAMPQHAIDEDVVDFVLAPENIPSRLLEIKELFSSTEGGIEKNDENKINEQFRQVILLLKTRVGVDFSFYKQTTVRRRILRRMVMLQLENIKNYRVYLQTHKVEQDILFNDLLIPVTFFFRDNEIFDSLCETIFPDILIDKSIAKPLRIWVAGCSTGQEAYSLAMCLHEFLGNKIAEVKIQIFATDLSEISIKKARSGLYSKKETELISPARLSQFFNKTDGNYQVKKEVRDMCVFAMHNFLKDPPFSNLDLISCRNVLIYLDPFLQKKAFNMFHYALNERGKLLLGKSETTGSSPDLFISNGKKDKIYTRQTVNGKFKARFIETTEKTFTHKNLLNKSDEKLPDFQKNADEIMLSRYSPPGVVINDVFDIVQFRGLTGEFLQPAPGKASLNVLKMAKEGLSFEIRNAHQKAKLTEAPFIKEGISLNNGNTLVTIEVVPLRNTIDIYFLITFRKEIEPIKIVHTVQDYMVNNANNNRIEQLEKELLQLREDMRSITEEQEAANEELQSSNEELLSGSEELQSLNEELETGKEELQSTNEELITVNQELFDRNEEVNQSRKFAEAIISVLHEPLLLLDSKFRIKSANAAFYKNFQLTENETLGKAFFNLHDKTWDIPELRSEFLEIGKDKNSKREAELKFLFPVLGERFICCNMESIKKDSGEELILLALNDVTERKNAEQRLKEKATGILKEYTMLHSYYMEAPAFFVILKGPEHIFEFANTMYHQLTGNRELLGNKMMEAMPELKNQGFIEIVDEIYKTGIPFSAKEMPALIEKEKGNLQQIYIDLNCQAIKDDKGEISGILIFGYDVTELIIGRKQLERNAEMIHSLYMNAPAFVCTMSGPKHTYELVNPSYQKIFGDRKIVGKPIMEALPELEGQGFDKILDNVYNTGEIFVGLEVPITLGRAEGLKPEICWFNFSYQPIYDDNNKITGILVFGYEVTEEVKGKKIQEQNAVRFRVLTDAMPQKMWMADSKGNINYLNNSWITYTQKSFDELKDLGWEKIIHPDDLKTYYQEWNHSLKTGAEFIVEQRFLRFDGVYRWHLSKALAQKEIDGTISTWIGTHTDINDQKIKQQQKDEFISIASHEMKTPLTTAKGFLQLLESTLGKENSEANIYAKKAIDSIERLNELITELLDVSKIQYGKLNYNIGEFDFNQMLESTVESIQFSSPKHKIIKTGTAGIIKGDRNRLQQVIINLLTNAVKYSPDSAEILIDIKDENGQLKVSVTDKGFGISKQNLDKIFDKYFRVEEHAIEFQGLGIGLFISHEIIVRHQGKLWAESEQGKGSSFYFTLPSKLNNIAG